MLSRAERGVVQFLGAFHEPEESSKLIVEGFGIAAPLTGLSNKPSSRFLLLAGLIGGGPTFLGTVLGSLWSSAIAYILFLSVAGGALVYVTMLMYNAGRRQATNDILMVGFFFGIIAGFLTDLIVTLAGA